MRRVKAAITVTFLNAALLMVPMAASGEPSKRELLLPPSQDSQKQVDETSRNKARRSGIFGFYAAPQSLTIVSPGDFGSVSSTCDLGDFAVSGSYTVYADNFSIVNNNLVIDGETGQQRWALQGTNKGSEGADIRIVAICADAVPLRR